MSENLCSLKSTTGKADITEVTSTGSNLYITGLEINTIYAISFGKYTNASSQNLQLTGATILYQNRDSSGGNYGANYGIAIIKTNATRIDSVGTNAMLLGSKVYRIG